MSNECRKTLQKGLLNGIGRPFLCKKFRHLWRVINSHSPNTNDPLPEGREGLMRCFLLLWGDGQRGFGMKADKGL